MPRCYMVRKEKERLENPPPCSPTEACIPPPYKSPAEDPALLAPTLAEDTSIERTDADTQAALNLLELSRSTPSVNNVTNVTDVEPIIVQPQIIYPFYTAFPSIPIQQTYPLSIYPVYGTIIEQTPFIDTSIFTFNGNYPSEPAQLCIEDIKSDATQETPEVKETKDACVGTEKILKRYRRLQLRKVETNRKVHSCTDCGKNYTTASSLSRHKQTHRSIDSSLAKHCYVCGKAYVSMSAYSMHIKSHSKTYNCSMCSKSFSRQWLLAGHQRTHNGVKPYICVCGKSFSDRSNYRVHQQTHSTQKLHNCKKCGKKFKLKMHAKRHMEKVACTPIFTTNYFPVNFYTPL